MKQAKTSFKPVLAHSTTERCDARVIYLCLGRRWQDLEPDCIETEATQTEHPLQWYGENAAAFRIFRRKPAPEKDRHGGNWLAGHLLHVQHIKPGQVPAAIYPACSARHSHLITLSYLTGRATSTN